MPDGENRRERRVNWELLVGVASIAVAIGVFLFQQERKALSFNFLGASRILSVNQPLETVGNIEILLDGEPIEGLLSYSIEFLNFGNVPIIPEDYVSPIAISLGSDGKIVSSEVRDANDAKLFADLSDGLSIQSTSELSIALPAVLLNPGDHFTLTILTTQSVETQPKIEARIVGISQVIPNDDRLDVTIFNFFTKSTSGSITLAALVAVGLNTLFVSARSLQKLLAGREEDEKPEVARRSSVPFGSSAGSHEAPKSGGLAGRLPIGRVDDRAPVQDKQLPIGSTRRDDTSSRPGSTSPFGPARKPSIGANLNRSQTDESSTSKGNPFSRPLPGSEAKPNPFSRPGQNPFGNRQQAGRQDQHDEEDEQL